MTKSQIGNTPETNFLESLPQEINKNISEVKCGCLYAFLILTTIIGNT
jgi:hypothetical protein